MEVKVGYKQTEVGVIPDEWGVKKLGELCTFTQGVQIPQSEQVRYPRDGYIRYLYIRDFFTDDFEWFVRDQHPSKIMGELDIMMVNTGSTAGMVYTGAKGVLSNNAFRIRYDKASLTRDFLFTFLTSPATQETIRNFANAAAQPHVGHKNIAQVPIGLPEIPEQCAIAEALSDVDALIGALDHLIAKKRDLKQAAMQQLLTGQTRLPGFHGEWEVKRLGDVAEIVMAQSPSSSNYNAKGVGLPLIQGNADVANRKTLRRIFTTEITKRGKCGDILMSVRAPVGEISRAVFDVCLGRGVCAIRYDNDFMYHYLISQEPSWAKLSKGSTFDSVNSTDVKALEIHLPIEAQEQNAIAEVLLDMDAELAGLEKRRDKTLALKQGMMQELLTGRTRLL